MKQIKYNTVEYPLEKVLNEIPRYSTNWTEIEQKEFIFYLLSGLPLMRLICDKDYYILKGRERIAAVQSFVTNELNPIEKNTPIVFKHLPLNKQRNFFRISVKLLVLETPLTDLNVLHLL